MFSRCKDVCVYGVMKCVDDYEKMLKSSIARAADVKALTEKDSTLAAMNEHMYSLLMKCVDGYEKNDQEFRCSRSGCKGAD